MKTAFPALLVIALILAGCASTGTTSAPGSIQGVWRFEGEQGTPGESGRGLVIFTRRHYSTTAQDAARPDFSSNAVGASADELRAIWGPFGAHAGVYEIDDGKIRVKPAVAKNPAAMSPESFIVYSYELDGNEMTITVIGNNYGLVTNPRPGRYVRVE